jgi:hypothetical protein
MTSSFAQNKMMMKYRFLFPVAVVLLSLSESIAQKNKTSENHFADSMENLAFEQLVSYISADTFNLNLEEAEKNSISHIGEHHTLTVPVNRGSGNEENDYVSWDKWLPSVYNKEATVGSPFLLFLYVPGLVVNSSLKIIQKPDYRYNYDKMSGNLLLIKNEDAPIAVYRDQVNMFCLKTDKGGLIFIKVPILNNNEFFQVIYKGLKYSVYKLYKNTFIKANQATNGYLNDGKDYDEYEDIVTYYLVDEKNESAQIFELKRKSVKQIFGAVSPLAKQYLSIHKYDVISEAVISNLTEELNK